MAGKAETAAVRKGDPLYVPAGETAMAHSLGAVMVEGDARLFVPSILPEGVALEAFGRWTGDVAKIVWIGEFLESLVGRSVDIMDVAGLLTASGNSREEKFVPLYVPSHEMDNARLIPGVHWDRGARTYVADETADFLLVHRYLTPAMKAAWVADRNIDTAVAALVRARAVIADRDDGEARESEKEPARQLQNRGAS